MRTIRNGILALATALIAAQAVIAQESNVYVAPRASVEPSIDGVVDAVWDLAPWDSISYNYLAGTANPVPSDFSGRYKVLWDSSKVYLLVEVVDDSIGDVSSDPATNYWEDEAVEIFLDENQNGGNHQYNFKAWAYHVSTLYDVVDYGADRKIHLYNDHIKVRRVQAGHVSVWEMSMLVYGENYTQAGPNTPLKLSVNKSMGFSLAYIDNDGRSTRDNFMGSVNTEGHLNNDGYIDASCFGTLELSPGQGTGIKKAPKARGIGKTSLLREMNGFRIEAFTPVGVEVLGLDGSVVDAFQASPGTTYGAKYAPGIYGVRTPDGITTRFAKLR